MLPGSESLDIDPLRAQFAQGKNGMYFNHSVKPSVYKTQLPTDIRWAVAMPPTIDGKQNGADQVITGSYLAMSKNSEHKEEAWKFIEWMYSDDVQVAYQGGGYGVSVIPSVAAKAKAPDIVGIENFLPTAMDGSTPPPRWSPPNPRRRHEESGVPEIKGVPGKFPPETAASSDPSAGVHSALLCGARRNG